MTSTAKGLGRGERSRVPHRRRPRVKNDALHVTMHLIDGLPSMRSPRAHGLVQRSIQKSQERFGCRVVQYAALSNHLHLIIEAENEAGLAQAMKGLKVRIARRALGAARACPPGCQAARPTAQTPRRPSSTLPSLAPTRPGPRFAGSLRERRGCGSG